MIKYPLANVHRYYDIEFSTFCKSHVRKFIKSKMLLLLSKVAWDIFTSEKKDNKHSNAILRSFAPRIFSLITANGTDFKRAIPDAKSINYLCNSYFQLNNSISDHSFKENEKHELLELFSSDGHVLNQLRNEEISLLYLHISVNRLFRTQWNTESGDINACLRSRKIFSEFRNIAQQKIVDANVKIDRILNLSETDFLKAALCIFTELMGRPSSNLCRAVFKIGSIKLDSELIERFGISKDTIHICILRLLGKNEDYANWFLRLQQMPDYYAMYSIPPLFRNPIIQIESESPICGYLFENDSYLIPSPKLLLRGVAKAFYLCTKENETLFNNDQERKFSIDVEYGSAIENYYEEFMTANLKNSSFHKISKSNDSKGADFVVSTDRFEFYIELKKSMASIESSNVLAPQDVYEQWCRLTNSAEQICSSIKKSSTSKIKIGLICYEEYFGMDAGSFVGLNYKNKKLQAMGVEYLEVFSFEMLELFIFDPDKEKVAEIIVKTQNEFAASGFNLQNFVPFNLNNFSHTGYDEYYESLYKSLFA